MDWLYLCNDPNSKERIHYLFWFARKSKPFSEYLQSFYSHSRLEWNFGISGKNFHINQTVQDNRSYNHDHKLVIRDKNPVWRWFAKWLWFQQRFMVSNLTTIWHPNYSTPIGRDFYGNFQSFLGILEFEVHFCSVLDAIICTRIWTFWWIFPIVHDCTRVKIQKLEYFHVIRGTIKVKNHFWIIICQKFKNRFHFKILKISHGVF